jgi:general secretion pathway protein J
MKKSRSTGMTLIELLIAVAVFGIFSVLAYGGLSRLIANRERLDVERQFWSEMSLAFTRMHDDLAHARARRVRDVSGFPLPAFRGEPTDTRALAEPSLEFTRGGEIDISAARRSDLRRVAYRLRDGTLERLTWPVLERAPVSEPIELPLLTNVEEFTVTFFAAVGTKSERWPTHETEVLPRAVEVTIQIAGRGRYTRLFLVNG